MAKTGYPSPYGTCALCGYVGTMTLHHIIPRRLKVRTDTDVRFVGYNKNRNLCIKKFNERIEDIQIGLCANCHKILHPENWEYYATERALIWKYKKEKEIGDIIKLKEVRV